MHPDLFTSTPAASSASSSGWSTPVAIPSRALVIPNSQDLPRPERSDSFVDMWRGREIKREETRRSQITLVDPPLFRRASFREYMLEELDQQSVRYPLALASFLSGFIGCISFSACSIWVGYQSGNTVQTAIAISRAIYDPSQTLHSFRVTDWQALSSVLSFAIACQIGGRLVPRGWHRKSRAWITISAIVQLFLTIGAAVAVYYCNEDTFNLSRTDPAWHNSMGYLTIILLSASMGLQGVVGESLGTGFTATVVLTSLYCQLAVLPSPRKWSSARDLRLTAIALFMLGGFVSHLLLVEIASHGALAVAAGLRLLLIPMWLMCKADGGKSPLPMFRTKTPEQEKRVASSASSMAVAESNHAPRRG